MKVVSSPAELKAYRKQLGESEVGFVPTMGALHAGHRSLLQRSVDENDVTVLSIYVNSTQFNNPDDLAKYPLTLSDDLKVAEEVGVDCVFTPDFEQMYPDNFAYRIVEQAFSTELCGAHRPGHFTGVLTVVMKLFNLVQPHRAYFGEKDFQQYQLIKGMAEAFFMDVDVVGCEIVREADGLAMSSRNLNLTPSNRLIAPALHEALQRKVSDEEVAKWLETQGFEVDYIQTKAGRRYGAASLGNVRLIDNIPTDQVGGE